MPQKRTLPRFAQRTGLRPHSMTARLDALCRLGSAITGGAPGFAKLGLGRVLAALLIAGRDQVVCFARLNCGGWLFSINICQFRDVVLFDGMSHLVRSLFAS
ncbi:MAG: hypothetical protein HYZ46_04325 [Nitrosomonadales bacterium]|nr:hypothetical protein [Nitrosomonadales bacterium]